MSEIKTIEDAVDFFVKGRRVLHIESEIRFLITQMVELPNPFSASFRKEWVTDASPRDAWNWVINFGLLYTTARHGWVMPEGKLLSANWAAHERLLYWLGLETADVEAAGWARVGPHGYQCMYRLTRAQKDRIEKSGLLVEKADERLKPARPADIPVINPFAGAEAMSSGATQAKG